MTLSSAGPRWNGRKGQTALRILTLVVLTEVMIEDLIPLWGYGHDDDQERRPERLFVDSVV
jgi:hypothetical protein